MRQSCWTVLAIGLLALPCTAQPQAADYKVGGNFDVEVVKAWDEGDTHLETVYFTGELFEGEKTRIFGHFGCPRRVEGKVPGILHIHGGGQTAGLDWPRFWAKRGYACLSFDFCGNTNLPNLGPGYHRERYTLWGKVPADMMKVSGGLQMKPTPRYNPWYHWTLAARRGLTFLETRPGVDAQSLGVFGISTGGTLTWSVAALDALLVGRRQSPPGRELGQKHANVFLFGRAVGRQDDKTNASPVGQPGGLDDARD